MAAPADTVFALRGLHVRFSTADEEVHAVRGIDLEVVRGETVAIVGESGSGKSQAVLAAMGLLASNGHAKGFATYKGKELLGLAPAALNRIRGRSVTMIFQEPMTSLDPLFPVGRQIAEPLAVHARLGRRQARARVLELLDLVGIDDPVARLAAYPHQLSGGQRQRVMIAMALANHPDLLIADEPTTALDVTIQAQILGLLMDLKQRLGMAMVFITHDLGIVRRIADRVYVMKDGEVVEHGPVGRIFSTPRADYTRMLLDAEPPAPTDRPATAGPVVLAARDIAVTFPLPSRPFAPRRTLRAVDGIDVTVRAGRTLGIVGESGSGKSTLGRALLRLVAASGSISFDGTAIDGLDRRAMRPLRRHMQIVFQDPFGSLSPRLTVGEIVSEGLLVHEPGIGAAERDRRAAAALAEVRLEPELRHRYPHEFSGGQRQRIAIARAMILKPRLVVLDEPTSALDRSVQNGIVALLRRLQAEHSLAYLFISHDLAVVRALADEIIVMRRGRVVEHGPARAIFESPREPYTRALIDAAFLAAPAPSG